MLKFYKCAKCGAVVAKIVEKPCPIMCCGEEMVELTANTEEASEQTANAVTTRFFILII